MHGPSLGVCMGNENTKLVKLLMQAGAPVGARDSDGNTALHYAAKMGHVGIVNILLMHDAAATAVNETGWSPLMMACKHALLVEYCSCACCRRGPHQQKRLLWEERLALRV